MEHPVQGLRAITSRQKQINISAHEKRERDNPSFSFPFCIHVVNVLEETHNHWERYILSLFFPVSSVYHHRHHHHILIL